MATGTGSAVRLRSAPSGRFWQQTAICLVSLWPLVAEQHPPNWARAQAVCRIGDKVKMKELEEQRVCVKFCCKLGKNFTETFQLLNQAYGEDCMGRTQCYEWFKRFEKGRMSVGEDPRPGRPCRESSCCDSWKPSFNCSRSCKRSGHQYRILPSNFDWKTSHVSYQCKIRAACRSSSAVIWQNIRHPLCPIHPILLT